MPNLTKTLIAAALIAAAGFLGGWTAQGWRMGTATAECRTEAAASVAEAASAALAEIRRDTAAMTAAAARVRQAGERSARAQDEAAKRWEALTQAQPLPAGCEPGKARAQAMGDAIERARREMTP